MISILKSYIRSKFIKESSTEYLVKKGLKERPVFDKSWTIAYNINDYQKEIMYEKLKYGIGYVE